jgi:hypothetical protein
MKHVFEAIEPGEAARQRMLSRILSGNEAKRPRRVPRFAPLVAAMALTVFVFGGIFLLGERQEPGAGIYDVQTLEALMSEYSEFVANQECSHNTGVVIDENVYCNECFIETQEWVASRTELMEWVLFSHWLREWYEFPVSTDELPQLLSRHEQESDVIHDEIDEIRTTMIAEFMRSVEDKNNWTLPLGEIREATRELYEQWQILSIEHEKELITWLADNLIYRAWLFEQMGKDAAFHEQIGQDSYITSCDYPPVTMPVYHHDNIPDVLMGGVYLYDLPEDTAVRYDDFPAEYGTITRATALNTAIREVPGTGNKGRALFAYRLTESFGSITEPLIYLAAIHHNNVTHDVYIDAVTGEVLDVVTKLTADVLTRIAKDILREALPEALPGKYNDGDDVLADTFLILTSNDEQWKTAKYTGYAKNGAEWSRDFSDLVNYEKVFELILDSATGENLGLTLIYW